MVLLIDVEEMPPLPVTAVYGIQPFPGDLLDDIEAESPDALWLMNHLGEDALRAMRGKLDELGREPAPDADWPVAWARSEYGGIFRMACSRTVPAGED